MKDEKVIKIVITGEQREECTMDIFTTEQMKDYEVIGALEVAIFQMKNNLLKRNKTIKG